MQLLFCHFRHFESLENDMLVIRRHIESLNDKMKSSDQQQSEPLDDTDSQVVKLLNTIQQEVYDVTSAKRDLEVQVSSLLEQKQSNER